MRPRLAVTAFVLTICAGCSGGVPQSVPVEGVVKIDGQPAGNLRIQFTPREWKTGAKVVSSNGVSDAQGKFVLKSDTGEPGAKIGVHNVIVVDGNFEKDGEPVPGERPSAPNRIPKPYTAAASTPIEVTVEASKTSGYEVNVSTKQ